MCVCAMYMSSGRVHWNCDVAKVIRVCLCVFLTAILHVDLCVYTIYPSCPAEKKKIFRDAAVEQESYNKQFLQERAFS